MPSSIIKYKSFDGKEFSNRDDAEEHEASVIKSGDILRQKFFEICEKEGPEFIDRRLLDFMRGKFLTDDAWKIMKSLYRAQDVMLRIMAQEESDTSWLLDFPEEEEDW